MHPNEILPAITRQKVKNKDGKIGEVVIVERVEGKDYACVLVEKDGEKYFESFALKDCEPVPEEPMGFRVNDKVVIEGKYGDAYTTVETLFVVNGKVCSLFTYGDTKEISLERVRHATPEEVAKYFN